MVLDICVFLRWLLNFFRLGCSVVLFYLPYCSQTVSC